MINLKLSELVNYIQVEGIRGNVEVKVTGLSSDSRKIEAGYIFFCIKGTRADGHQFAAEAVKRGASAVICEEEVKLENNEVAVIKVKDARRAYAVLSAAFFGFPSRFMKVAGVTGTNGKTTTTHLIESIFKSEGKRTGLIGTVYVRIVDTQLPVTHTTPDPFELQSIFDAMRKENVEVVAMEVSSHAIDQKRIEGTYFDVLVFTNLTQDHLDYHQTIEEYAKAKMSLFMENRHIPWVINLDDPKGKELYQIAKKLGVEVLTYGVHENADLKARDIESGFDRLKFNLRFRDKESYQVELMIAGHFNVYNAMAALGSAYLLGVPFENSVKNIASAKGAPGRFDIIKSESGFYIIVDYAHTPDGLNNVIDSCLKLLKPKGRLITVFGCGGDRDKEKRPKMGAIASEKSHHVIVTSDNPRSEDPVKIIEDILKGVAAENMYKVEVEVDRREAIFKAVHLARPGDIVLIAGKGHETYQIFKDKTVHFDDKEVAREAIAERTE